MSGLRRQLLMFAALAGFGLALLGFLLAVMLLSRSSGQNDVSLLPRARATSIGRPRLTQPRQRQSRPQDGQTAKRVAADAETSARVLNRISQLGLPVYCGSARRRMVALSFDDGPGVETLRLLALLKQAHAGATFFSVGNVAQSRTQQLLWQAAQAEIGDHSWSHPDLAALNPSQDWSQLFDTRALLRKLTGQQVQLFRPPYGDRDPAVDQMVARAGMIEVLWSVDTSDWKATSSAEIVAAVARSARPGSIILLHDIHPLTIAAVPQILALLEQRHLQVVGVSQLLAEDTPSAAQLRQGESACFAHQGRSWSS